MSFAHWWLGFFADESAYASLEPHFSAAAQKAILTTAAEQALADWRARPADFEQDAFDASAAAAARVNAFIWAFNLPGFDELAKQLLTREGTLAAVATEDCLFRIEMVARNTPLSIVWHALGNERASLLPGQMGNMLLHPREIEDALKQTRQAYADTSRSDLLDAARRYCRRDVGDETLLSVLEFLPQGMAQAAKTGQGFLALARAQI
jgi:hypothetical protein